MYTLIRDKLIDFWSTFHGSETIIWARAQVMLGCLYTGYTLIEPSSFTDIPPHYVQAWIVGNGVLSEYLRRRKAEYDGEGGIK